MWPNPREYRSATSASASSCARVEHALRDLHAQHLEVGVLPLAVDAAHEPERAPFVGTDLASLEPIRAWRRTRRRPSRRRTRGACGRTYRDGHAQPLLGPTSRAAVGLARRRSIRSVMRAGRPRQSRRFLDPDGREHCLRPQRGQRVVHVSDCSVDAPKSTAAGVCGRHPRSISRAAIAPTCPRPISTTTVARVRRALRESAGSLLAVAGHHDEAGRQSAMA